MFFYLLYSNLSLSFITSCLIISAHSVVNFFCHSAGQGVIPKGPQLTRRTVSCELSVRGRVHWFSGFVLTAWAYNRCGEWPWPPTLMKHKKTFLNFYYENRVACSLVVEHSCEFPSDRDPSLLLSMASFYQAASGSDCLLDPDTYTKHLFQTGNYIFLEVAFKFSPVRALAWDLVTTLLPCFLKGTCTGVERRAEVNSDVLDVMNDFLD